jgi:hypothetical protein
MKTKRLFNIYGATGGSYAGNVYDRNAIAPAILANGGGNSQPLIVVYEEEDNNL